MENDKKIDNMSKIVNNMNEIINKISIGFSRSFRLVGGIGILVSIWTNTDGIFDTLALKISLVTFIFGGFAKIIEMLNKRESVKNNAEFQALVWLIFLIFYIFVINSNIQIIQIC